MLEVASSSLVWRADQKVQVSEETAQRCGEQGRIEVAPNPCISRAYWDVIVKEIKNQLQKSNLAFKYVVT